MLLIILYVSLVSLDRKLIEQPNSFSLSLSLSLSLSSVREWFSQPLISCVLVCCGERSLLARRSKTVESPSAEIVPYSSCLLQRRLCQEGNRRGFDDLSTLKVIINLLFISAYERELPFWIIILRRQALCFFVLFNSFY